MQPGTPEGEKANVLVEKPITREYSLLDLIKRPGVNYQDVASLKGEAVSDPQIYSQVEVQIKYAGYIGRQSDEIDRLRRYENTLIPADFDYMSLEGLSNEVKQKLTESTPDTLARASRIPGVTPAAISLLLIHLKKRGMIAHKKTSNIA